MARNPDRRVSKLPIWSLSPVVLLAFAWVGSATLFQPLSIDSLADQAELVVQGKVLSKSCQRDSRGSIYTSIELEVQDLWKGSVPGNRITVVHGGGIVGEERTAVVGQVEYGIGEEVVAFLTRNTRGEGVTLGLMQGKFHIWADATTKAQYVFSPFHGVPEGSKGRLLVEGQRATSSAPARMSLAELKRRVLEAHP